MSILPPLLSETAAQKMDNANTVTIPLLPISIDIHRYFQKYRDIDIDILSQ